MSTPRTRPLHRHAHLLALIALVAVAALALHGPIVQWAGYHAFADDRPWAGVPHAWNVISNLPFALAGLWAWPKLREAGAAWRAFCAAIVATAFGSSVYHWQPNDLTLLVDRLPIAWACASLMCAFLSERIDPAWRSTRVVSCALVAASAAVAWWGIGTVVGIGDLRPYVLVQFLPMLLIPAALLLRMRRDAGGGVPDGVWWAALALYAAAKGLEVADGAVLDVLHAVSGHSLKHLVAAGAAALLLHARAQQRPIQLR